MTAAKPTGVATTKSDLPEGWSLAKLEEISTAPQYGWTTSATKTPKGLKLVRTSDISDGDVDWGSVPSCKDEPDDIEKFLLKSSDILVSRAGSVGVSYLVTEAPRAVFASYLIRFRPLPPIDARFITFFMKSPEYWSAIADETAGITIPNVNASKLKQLDVPIPPLGEQKRIVEKVEQLLARVNAAREQLARVPAILKRFRQAVLAAACSGRLTADWREQNSGTIPPANELLERVRQERQTLWAEETAERGSGAKYPRRVVPNPDFEADLPEGWSIASIDELSIRITSGSRDWKRYYRDDGPGTFIMAQNVRPLFFDRSYRLAVDPPSNDRDRERSEVRQSDILVTIVGANTGDVCRVTERVRQHYVCQSVALIRPVMTEISPFIELYLNSPLHGQAQYQDWIYGEGRPHLSFDHLRETAVLLPPREEQCEIVRRVEALFRLADAIEKRVAAATARAEKLTQAILAKAFRGELVPTEAELAHREGRPYEPASALLARIKELRSGAQGSKRRHPRY